MKRIDQINVIPFIDIMLVLLAILLTTATFIGEGRLQIQLPAASSQAPAESPRAIEIGIDAQGGLYLDAEPLTLADLEGHLDRLAKDSPIRLRVDAATRFDRFVAVIDRLQAREFERLTILTRQP